MTPLLPNGEQLWRIQASNAAGQVEAFNLGTNYSMTKMYDPYSGRISQIRGYTGAQTHIEQYYSWDSQGNLKARKDEVQNLFEQFSYDSLDRLTNNQLSGSTSRSDSFTYNHIGNLTSKSGLGSYTYGQTTCGQKAGPHAVTNISIKGQFCYDKNGNQISGDGRTITYTAFNKAKTIVNGAKNTEFWHDGNRQLYKRRDNNKTTYFMGAYQKEVEGSTTIHRYRIGNFAVIEKNGSSFENIFQVTDHLGSIIAAVNANGSHKTRFSYDPWGLRRVLTGEIYASSITHLSIPEITRGYTGHEHIDSLNLIDMKGRVYSPEIGRFLSADPFVQSPHNLQSYNRYSYVLNNPLKYNDPSGYFFKKIKKRWNKTWNSAKKHSREIAAVAATVVTAGAFMAYAAAASCLAPAAVIQAKVAAGAVSGFVGGAVSGGNIRSAITGGITGGMFGSLHAWSPSTIGGYAGKTIAHGSVSGLSAEMNGGEFRHGFGAGAFTQAASLSGAFEGYGTLGNATGSSIVGGVGSVIAGGEFSYGAVQGVYSRFLNDLVTIRTSFRWPQFIGTGIRKVFGLDITPVGISVGYAEELPNLSAEERDKGIFLTVDMPIAGGGKSKNWGASVSENVGYLAHDNVSQMAGTGYEAGFTAGVVEVNSSFDGNGNYVGNSIGPGVGINVHSTYSATFTYSKKHGFSNGGL